MGFTHIDKEKLDSIATELIVEPLNALHGACGHRTGSGAEYQQNVLFSAVVTQVNGFPFEGSRLEIRSFVAWLGAGESCRSSFLKQITAKTGVIVVAESQHVDSCSQSFFGSMPAGQLSWPSIADGLTMLGIMCTKPTNPDTWRSSEKLLKLQ
jgi:hypothetical protein